jgi:hypothetical protein
MYSKGFQSHILCRAVRWLTCLLTVAALSIACSTNTPAPDQMTRTMSDTAPADLQLLCAEAANTDGMSARALPTSSRRLDANNYRVDLNVRGSTKACVISTTGTIVSVQAS